MQEEIKKDEWEDEPKGGWWILLLFGLPWILGMGVLGIFLLELID
jgi:hypothetical protein